MIMHIEIGIIDPLRIAAANAVALGVVASQAQNFMKEPQTVVKAGLAAIVFSVLMQIWHLPVGPSELHLIGAMTVYLLFGFSATIMGFAFGLLLQTVIEPQDFYHLGVNALSLMVPLVLVHLTYGRRLMDAASAECFTFARVVRLDAIYYGGVSAMVAFWLMISNDPAPVTDWARWALAYMPIFVLEALITFGAVTLAGRWRDQPVMRNYSEVGRLQFAA
jgi:cobalt/nickel transport system permease protein